MKQRRTIASMMMWTIDRCDNDVNGNVDNDDDDDSGDENDDDGGYDDELL